MAKLKPAPLPTKKYTKASDALRAARDLIRNKNRWTTGDLAVKYRDNETHRCTTKSKDAVAFCALGAVKRVNGPAEKAAIAFLRAAGLHLRAQLASGESKVFYTPEPPYTVGDQDIFSINDDYGHEYVLRMFSRAIRQAKKAGK